MLLLLNDCTQQAQPVLQQSAEDNDYNLYFTVFCMVHKTSFFKNLFLQRTVIFCNLEAKILHRIINTIMTLTTLLTSCGMQMKACL